MSNYLSVAGVCVTEKVIERSRFITTSKHVEGEEEAKAFVEEVRRQYRDATHNCYAYVADTLGNLLRFSDDGEPQGTAGMPMLDVLRQKKLMQTAVVVTRYFGGIKLGAGGLLRAYSGSVAENLLQAQFVHYLPCVQSIVLVDYSLVEVCQRFFASHGCQVVETEYGNDVTFTIAMKQEAEEQVYADLTNLLNGQVYVERVKDYDFPFPVQQS